jgi:hypothetical protein
VRGWLLNLLQNFLDPIPAELLLLWLLGRVRSHRYRSLPMGLISLNFRKARPRDVAVLIQLLGFLCPALNVVTVTIGQLNEAELRPTAFSGHFMTTALSGMNDTRLVIDETGLLPGSLTARGTDGLRLLQEVLSSQQSGIDIDGIVYEQFVSFPGLLLSAEKSLLKCDVSMPIGDVRAGEIDLDEGVVAQVRDYVENARFQEFHIPADSQGVIAAQVEQAMRIDERITQGDLHLLMAINELASLSVGALEPTPEIWDHAIELFRAILAEKYGI